jgi:geranylgeranyl diphosphate synthase type II
MKIGAIIGGAPKSSADHFYEFGKNIGIAFQLQDDILDVFGDSEKFGKQVGGDILSNKKTYLLLTALELAKGEIKSELEEWLSKKIFDPTEKVLAIKEIYRKLDIKKFAQQKMNEFHQKAMLHFEAIDCEKDKKQNLLGFAESLLIREL